MKLKASLLVASFAIAALFLSTRLARAEERGERGGERRVERQEQRRAPPRQAPPRFQPHPPGGHPHGPIVRGHSIRVLAPRVQVYGQRQYRHWEHPEFSRPVYYWEWNNIRSVSCVAEDSYGDQYPVTENTFEGFGLVNMTNVEDDALDRCNEESGGDPTCYLATCSHY